MVDNEATLTLISTLTRNISQNPREDKYRRVRLTNPKIAAALVEVKGAVDVMLHLGWVHVRPPPPLHIEIYERDAGRGLASAWRTHTRARRRTLRKHACATGTEDAGGKEA